MRIELALTQSLQKAHAWKGFCSTECVWNLRQLFRLAGKDIRLHWRGWAVIKTHPWDSSDGAIRPKPHAFTERQLGSSKDI